MFQKDSVLLLGGIVIPGSWYLVLYKSRELMGELGRADQQKNLL